MTDEKTLEPNVQEENEIPAGVLYRPGEEPERIRLRIERLFEKLDGAYPDRVIQGLQRDHDSWADTVTELYRQLGYPDGNSFLRAYGYTVVLGRGGAPRKNDPFAIVARLKELYPEGTGLSVAQLKEEHPEIPWKSLQNMSVESFGMPLVRYLVQEGILSSERARKAADSRFDVEQVEALIATLQARYANKEKPTTFKTLAEENPDLPIASLNAGAIRWFGESAAVHLTKRGILQSRRGISDEEKLASIEAALLEKYKGKEPLPTTVRQIKQENPELKLSALDALVLKVKGVKAKEYLTSIGVLAAEKTPEEKLEQILAVLKKRYIGTRKVAYSLPDLQEQNEDVKVSELRKLIKLVTERDAREYLLELGILSKTEWEIREQQEEERLERKRAEQSARFQNDLPADELIRHYSDLYTGQTTDNPYFSLPLPEEVPEEQSTGRKKAKPVPDENHCVVENGVLVDCIAPGAREITVSDGVIVVEENALDHVYNSDWSSNLEKVYLPNTVRIIRELFESFDKIDMNIPRGYLLQKEPLPLLPLEVLLCGVWQYESGMLDWVSIFLYQDKKLNEYCVQAFNTAPNAFVAASLAILNNDDNANRIYRVTEKIFDLREKISQPFLDRFFVFTKEKNVRKAAAVLQPYASQDVGGTAGVEKTYANELEAFCDANFAEHELDRVLQKSGCKAAIFQKSGVKYRESGDEVSAFVLECAVLPYVGQMQERPRAFGGYKTDFSRFTFLEKCDAIVSHFEPASFTAFLETLAEQAGGYRKPQLWIPVCRFGTGSQINTLIAQLRTWSKWGDAGVSGRSAIIVCRGAVLLSETREAMLYADKCNCLDYYAQIRKTSADLIRDTKLADFGLDADGKKRYDLGNTVIEATVGDDLSVQLYDTVAAKPVRSLPKRGADEAKYTACAADYAELRKNVKKVVKARNDMLFDCFLSGKKFDAPSWLLVYIENPVLYKVAQLLVWSQNKATFTLRDGGAIDSFGNSYQIDETKPITVAHPKAMKDEEIARWQSYLTKNGLKQPFEQMWEPKIDFSTVQPDRYKGCLIPYFRFLNQEKHGITVWDRDFHNDIEIRLYGCNEADIVRIDNARHSIEMTDRFEVRSFHLIAKDSAVNHLVFYLDQCAMYGWIEQDQASALQHLESFTVAQIDKFLRYAEEKGSKKCAAVLEEFKKEHFTAFDAVDGFTLNLS